MFCFVIYYSFLLKVNTTLKQYHATFTHHTNQHHAHLKLYLKITIQLNILASLAISYTHKSTLLDFFFLGKVHFLNDLNEPLELNCNIQK